MPIIRSVGLRGGGAASAPPPNGPDDTQDHWIATIQASQVDNALSDYTFYVDLGHPDMPGHFWSNVQADGGDIRVTSEDGETQFPVELVNIDTGAETGEVHCLVPSVLSSVDTSVRVYYNGVTTLSQPGVGDAYGRNAVWADYHHVLHFADWPVVDSTGHDSNPTEHGVSSGDIEAAQIGNGMRFAEGDTEGIVLQDRYSNTVYVSAWAKADQLASLADYHFSIASKWGDGGAVAEVLGAILWQSDLWTFIVYHDGGSSTSASATSAITPGEWHHLAGNYDGSKVEAHMDGANSASTALSSDIEESTNTWKAASRGDGAKSPPIERTFDGVLDEWRVRASGVPSGWVEAEYANQNAPATFYTVTTP